MKAITYLADGFEETEAVAVIDLLRRASIETVLVGVSTADPAWAVSARGLPLRVEIPLEAAVAEAELHFLPGGQPGVRNLGASEVLERRIAAALSKNVWVGALCAAPSLLLDWNLATGRRVCCHPSVGERFRESGGWVEGAVHVDGNLVTGRAMADSVRFGLTLVRLMKGEAESRRIAEAICHEGAL